MDYWLHLAVLFGVYASLGLSLNVAMGQTGLLSVAHAAFFGVGAYATAIFMTRTSYPFVVVLPAAMLFAGLAAFPLGLAAGRLGSDRFVVASLAYQALLSSLFENWIAVTGGPLGVAQIPQRIMLESAQLSNFGFATVALILASLSCLVVWRLSTGPFSRVLHCIRDNETVALALGKNVVRVKLQIIVLTAMMAGATGSVYAVYSTYIDPSSFTLSVSITVAAIAIIGDRKIVGPIFGAAIFVLLPEFLRSAGFPDSIAAGLNQVLFGIALVWIVMSRAGGLRVLTIGAVYRSLNWTKT